MRIYRACGAVLLLTSNLAQAEWSLNLTAASDYLFNGITQTDHQPALQLGLEWSSPQGFYLGTWGSNVDFGDDTQLEIDGYLGYRLTYRPEYTLDAGVALYTYHGGSESSEGNYPELYLKFGIAGWGLNLWYATDYGGLGARHLVVMLQKEFALNEHWSLIAQIDRSTSLDTECFAWDGDRESYLHWQLMAQTQLLGFDLALGVSGTTLSDPAGDTRLLATIGRTFVF